MCILLLDTKHYIDTLDPTQHPEKSTVRSSTTLPQLTIYITCYTPLEWPYSILNTCVCPWISFYALKHARSIALWHSEWYQIHWITKPSLDSPQLIKYILKQLVSCHKNFPSLVCTRNIDIVCTTLPQCYHALNFSVIVIIQFKEWRTIPCKHYNPSNVTTTTLVEYNNDWYQLVV